MEEFPIEMEDIESVGGKFKNIKENIFGSLFKRRKPSPPFEKNSRICIVGAGPAGIHMAMRLKKLGYGQVTVLEKTNRIGGKSMTVTTPDGVPHEMGTCYLHSLYEPVRELLEEYHISPEMVLGGVPFKDKRDVFQTDLGYPAPPGSKNVKKIAFNDWILAKVEELVLPESLHWLPDQAQALSVLGALRKYAKIHKSIFGDHPYGQLPRPKDMSLIDMTFLEFLEKNELLALVPTFMYSQSIQGYGMLNEVPAFYGLWWSTPKIFALLQVAETYLFSENKSLVTVLRDGFQTIWETIVEKENIKVLTNVDIKSIKRGRRVIVEAITTNPGTSQNRNTREIETMEFDFLVLASNLQECMSFMDDLSSVEKDIFSRIKHYTIATTLYEADARAGRNIVYWWPNVMWKAEGRLQAQRVSQMATRPHLAQSSEDRAVAYQFFDRPPEQDDPELLRRFLMEDLSETGETNIRILKQRVWKYFPHFDQSDINEGYPWKLNSIQGSNKTWYCGASACYESVLDVITHNNRIIDLYKFN